MGLSGTVITVRWEGKHSSNCLTAGSKLCLLLGKPQPHTIRYLSLEKSACSTCSYLSPTLRIAMEESGSVRSSSAFREAGMP